MQKQEVREAIELPLIQHHLYQQIGIDPPRGVLLYGPPGKLRTKRVMLRALMTLYSCILLSIAFLQRHGQDNDGQGCGRGHRSDLYQYGGKYNDVGLVY
jgi:hypothetical protein